MNNRLHSARLLAFVTGLVNQKCCCANEYLLAENRILRAHLPSRLRLTDLERCTLAEIAKRVGRKAMKDDVTKLLRGFRGRCKGNARRLRGFREAQLETASDAGQKDNRGFRTLQGKREG